MAKNSIHFFFLLFILQVIYINIAESILLRSPLCNNIEYKSTVMKLRNYLFCKYDSDIRPVRKNNNVTKVEMFIKPHFIEYIQETEVFTLQAMMTLVWEDPHFKWDRQQYNIEFINTPAYKIWTPDITLHNEKRDEESQNSDGTCNITQKGEILCVYRAELPVYCSADNTWWPYNIINCTLEFGSWSHSNDEMQIDINDYMVVNLTHYKKNAELDLLKVYVTEREEKHKYNENVIVKMFSYHFILRRHWGIILIAFVTPMIILMVMTLTTLWLEPKSLERMIIANLNFICHLLCLQNVYWEMPRSGFNLPNLLIFYVRSFAMALFVLILTNILRQLQELTTEPPKWIATATTFILRSRVGQIFLIGMLDPAATAMIEIDADDNTDLVQSNNKNRITSPWRHITILIGWLAFLSVLFSYIVLFTMYFPTYYNINVSDL